MTGDKAKTLNSAATDTDHIPCVLEPIPLNTLSISHGSGGDMRRGDGIGEAGQPQFSISCSHPHAVAYGFDPQADRDVGQYFHQEKGNPLVNGTCPGYKNGVVYAMDRAAFNQGQNAQYNPEITDSGVNSTLVARGPGAVCYTVDEKCGNTYARENQANPFAARDYKQPQGVAYAMQGFGDYKQSEQASACKARDYKDATDLVIHPRYIVRRLTPTECARLQGFADRWGDIEPKTDFTEDELRFWLEVRNTHATINGKAVKDYTKKQMLTWYSKLQTDSAEYKMWGNGIALPPALYVLQGMVDVLEMSRIYDEATLASYTEDDLDWLD